MSKLYFKLHGRFLAFVSVAGCLVSASLPLLSASAHTEGEVGALEVLAHLPWCRSVRLLERVRLLCQNMMFLGSNDRFGGLLVTTVNNFRLLPLLPVWGISSSSACVRQPKCLLPPSGVWNVRWSVAQCHAQ